jgi:hypothetical protein
MGQLHGGRLPATAPPRREIPWLPILVLAVVTAAWLARVFFLSAVMPLWMDEVLTLWLLRLPDTGTIYQALERGAQYTPPAHPDLLYLWQKLAGASYLSLRIPSILGVLVTAMAIFLLLRRYVPLAIAAAGFILCLTQPFTLFATQTRPYPFTLACLAIAVLVWDDLPMDLHPLTATTVTRLGLIVVLIAAGFAFHLFFFFSVLSLGMIELSLEIRSRRLRLPVWIALLLGCLTSLYWLPLFRQFRVFTQGDRGPLYAAAPHLRSFAISLFTLSNQSLLFLFLLALVCLLALAVRIKPNQPPSSGARADLSPLWSIALSLAAYPFVTFLVARLFSGIYTVRYALPGTLGFILLTCLAVHLMPLPAKLVTVPLAALLAGLIYLPLAVHPGQVANLHGVFEAAAQPYPVALAEPLIFFAKEEDRTLSTEQRARLIYLTLPPTFTFGDPTAERQVKRWKAINPALPVATLDSYLAAHRCFYLYDTFQTDDDITRYLAEHRVQPLQVTHINNGYLGEFCP